MARKEKHIHYLYKTTCNVTGKWYIGMHSTNNENDGYMGSGKILRYSIRKYGVDNHTKEILEYCETRDLLVLRESEIITKELISDGLCINLKEGGSGGFSSEEHRLKFIKNGNEAKNKKLKEDSVFYENYIKKLSDLTKQSIIDGVRTTWKDNYDWTGKKHSEDTKEKMRKPKNIGENNSQYGTCWITKDGENKKIKKEELENWLKKDWFKGRIIK